MAVNIYIPSSSGAIDTPAGSIRLKFYYDGSGSDANLGELAWFESKLKYDFRLKSNGEISLSSLKIGLDNRDNIWETTNGGIFDAAADVNKICVDLIKDGSTFWSGALDYMNIEEDEYQYHDSTLTYRVLKLPFLDKIKLLQYITAAEAGISSGDSVADIVAACASELDMISDYTYENFYFDEISGRRFGVRSSFPQFSLKLDNIDPSENCLNILKRLALGFGFIFYNYAGALRVQDRNSSTFSALNAETNGYPIRRIPKKQPIKYVAVKGTKEWNDLSNEANVNFNLPSDTRRFSVGSEDANSSQNFILDLSESLKNIYYDAYSSGQTYTPGSAETGFSASDPTERPGEIKVDNPALGIGFSDSGWEAESGMIAELNVGNNSPSRFFTIVTHWSGTASSFYIIGNGYEASEISADLICRIYRKKSTGWTGTWNKYYKIYPILKTVAEIYAESLMGDKALHVEQPENFRHPYLGFSFETENYFIQKIEYDFKSGSCAYEADALGASPTVSASNDVGQGVNSVDAVDDGTHKVTASAIYNHINDRTIHLSLSPNGVTYFPMTDENGVKHYVQLKIYKGRLLLDIESLAQPD